MITRDILTSNKEGINLEIKNIEDDKDLKVNLNWYVGLIKDLIDREHLDMFIHTRAYRKEFVYRKES